jgi:NhaP-type Na+/H+ or K+/H+ antiporter
MTPLKHALRDSYSPYWIISSFIISYLLLLAIQTWIKLLKENIAHVWWLDALIIAGLQIIVRPIYFYALYKYREQKEAK